MIKKWPKNIWEVKSEVIWKKYNIVSCSIEGNVVYIHIYIQIMLACICAKNYAHSEATDFLSDVVR